MADDLTGVTGGAAPLDVDAIRAKYTQEREKRLRGAGPIDDWPGMEVATRA
jgi:hypothetical protein